MSDDALDARHADALAAIKADPAYGRVRLLCMVGGIPIGLIAFAMGILNGEVGLAIGGGLAFWFVVSGVAVWLNSAIAHTRATQAVERPYIEEWGRSRGWTYVEEAPPHSHPLLLVPNVGDFGDGFEGEMLPGVDGAVYNFAWFGADREDRTETRRFQKLLLCFDVPTSFQRVVVGPNRRGTPLLSGDADLGRRLQVESVDFDRDFVVLASEADDELALQRLFDPELQMHMLDTQDRLRRETFQRMFGGELPASLDELTKVQQLALRGVTYPELQLFEDGVYLMLERAIDWSEDDDRAAVDELRELARPLLDRIAEIARDDLRGTSAA